MERVINSLSFTAVVCVLLPIVWCAFVIALVLFIGLTVWTAARTGFEWLQDRWEKTKCDT